ncbi:MAG: glycerol-3-phosphate responsive antiterminator [Armatimonadota bacterium]|nr:glycerol-3-phosphate responsive antiterminator [Armatimonadota bacterium]MDR5702549.1 glycerol-3-phosphate responsive antiterminator [Armatimonadota bacterium]MDR7434461.1 glycerol-3-phosphate responsive antiterminator [Armatimonadota bacterium]
MGTLFVRFRTTPIIAAIRREELTTEALSSSVAACFFLTGNLLNIERLVQEVKGAGKFVGVHLDLLEGIAPDRYGIRFLATLGVDTLITTRSHLVHLIKEEGILAIQRVFLLDSGALQTAARVVKDASPDAVEVLPGLIYRYLAEEVRKVVPVPIIAGGFIRTVEEAKEALRAGALAVSTSTQALWKYKDWTLRP